MTDDFDEFIAWLKSRLINPLPETGVHRSMMPTKINGERVNFRPSRDHKLGSVLLLLYPFQGEIYLPLMKRPEYDGVHSGQISFPGGKQEPGDDSLITTALREGEEEVGIIKEDVQILGNLSEHIISASNFKVLPVVGNLNYRPNFIPDKYEVAGVMETSLRHLLDDNNIKTTEILVGNRYRIETPYYDVDGEIVWGATAMMLSEFLNLIKTEFPK